MWSACFCTTRKVASACWKLSGSTFRSQFRALGSRWTEAQIRDTIKQAIEGGTVYDATNKETLASATEYVNPSNGQFVVVDNTTGQVIQVSGPGHLPDYLKTK
jgi:hypothetical protein